jgi:hypothetical protein
LVAAASSGIYIYNAMGYWSRTSAPMQPWVSIASSFDGSKLAAAAAAAAVVGAGGGGDGGANGLGSFIYVSLDGGSTWLQSSPPSLPPPPSSFSLGATAGSPAAVAVADAVSWGAVIVSGDGRKLAAVSGSKIFIGTLRGGSNSSVPSAVPNLGPRSPGPAPAPSLVFWNKTQAYNWTRASVSLPAGNWSSLASSGDGRALAVSTNLYPSKGLIFTSVDGGVSWTQTSAPAKSWNGIASSVNGSRLAAAAADGIYTSADGGLTWRLSAGASNVSKSLAGQHPWSCIASSADGRKLVAAIRNHGIYVSTDRGVHWNKTSALTGLQWNALSSSGDGGKLAASAAGYVYISTSGGKPASCLRLAPRYRRP